MFGGGFKIVREGLRRCLKGRAKKRERREEGKRGSNCIKHLGGFLGGLKLRLSMAGWSRKILQL